MVDPRLIGRDLSLVYAREDHWNVYAPRGGGASEMERIARNCCCESAADHGPPDARSSCWADTQIQRFAAGVSTELAHSVWLQLSTNRHLSVVARQMANPQLTSSDAMNRCATSD